MYFCYRFSIANRAGHVMERNHSFLLCYHTLISTSTPLGSSNFIRASMVFEEEL
jgi:hypothetical protein